MLKNLFLKLLNKSVMTIKRLEVILNKDYNNHYIAGEEIKVFKKFNYLLFDFFLREQLNY